MAGYEQTIIVGNVGRDPETRYIPSGASVTSFSVAVSRRWKDKTSGETKENTNWYNISCWGPIGETAAKFIKKGTQVMVTGTVSARAYTGNDGQMRSSLDLRADNFQLLGGRGDSMSQDNDNNYSYDNNNSGGGGSSVDDIPF